MRRYAILLAFLCAVAGSSARLGADETDPLAAFVSAYGHYEAGKYDAAEKLFQKTLEEGFPLADYSLYYLASIAFARQDWEKSRRIGARLRTDYPQSLWCDAVELQQAKADLGEQKFTQAIAELRALRAKKSVRGAIAEEALYLQAQAAQGDPKQAHALYQQLREQFPQSKWTSAARREQASLREKHPDLFPFHTIASLSGEADQLVRERAYAEAETLYRKLLNNTDEAGLRLRLLGKLSDMYLKLRRRSEAMPLLERIAREYPETHEAPKALYQIGQILWNRHENLQALEYFNRVMEKYPGSTVLDRTLYAAGDIHEWLGKKDQAIAYYGKVRLRFPHSPVKDDATWRLAWVYYRGGEYLEAYRTFKVLAEETRSSALKTGAFYWQGRAAEKAGDKELAMRIYGEVYDISQENYYQTLAAGALARLGTPVNDGFAVPRPTGRNIPPPTQGTATFHLSRARTLGALGLHPLAVAELNAVERLTDMSSEMRLFLSHEFFKNKAYRQSLAMANRLPADEEERDFYRFPLAHWDMIRRKAQEKGIDPYLILALIRQESLFDARARSPAYALGLMQLLPSTAARMAKRIGEPAPSIEKLYDPEVNLTLGMQYLKELLQRYSDDWFKAVAAYNAGEGAVDRWEREIAASDTEEFVERIPYVETRGYVKLVMRNHRIYKKLYDSSQ